MIRLSTSLAAPLFGIVIALHAAAAPAQTPARTDDRGNAAALAAGDPWSATVAVSGRGAEEQGEAQTLAMRAVLLANSGDKTLLNRDEVREALREASAYVARFDYVTPAPGSIIAPDTPLTAAVRASGEATRLMIVRFDRERLGTLIGGGTRGAAADADEGAPADPFLDVDAALLWLLIEDGRREILVSDPAARNVRERAREIAGASGLSLRYPTGDAEDRAALDAAAIREERLDRVRLASARYAMPATLVGHLARDGRRAWEGRWTKVSGEAVASESFTSDSLDEALQAGLGWLSSGGGDSSYRYGGRAVSDAEALVWVGPLDSIVAYATVMDFLAGVPGVGTVYPKEIDERGMVFTVVPRGALPAIASAAASAGWLRRSSPPPPPVDPDAGAFGGERGNGGADVADRRGAITAPGAAAAPADGGDAVGTGRGRSGGAGTAPTPPRLPLASSAELAFDYLR